ncbi:MAG: S1 RNA-binding domain-containing protein [Candidatus Paceibacterota bacterium]
MTTTTMQNLLDKHDAKPVKADQILEGEIIKVGKATIYVDLGAKGTGVIFGKEFFRAKQELKEVDIGDEIPVKVINPDSEEGFVELSLKEASQEITWDKIKDRKEEDESFEVKITGANKGGLLTNVSGISAFIPASQLAPDHYPDVEDGDKNRILQELQELVGENLKVKILNLDPEEEKLILSEKATQENKIEEELENFEVGDVVEGEITGIVDFGAFMRFEGEEQPIEGLIHISELDWQLVEDPSEIVEEGEDVEAKIIEINGDRVSLSLKALKDNPWEDVEDKFEKGEVVEGEVTKFDSFGAFVKLAPKIQGLCHVSCFGSKKKMHSTLELGETYPFEITLINPEEHKIILEPTHEDNS